MMPNITLVKSDGDENRFQQKHETELEIGPKATLVFSADEHQCISKCSIQNKLERLQIEQAGVDTREHFIYMKTPVEEYHRDFVSEFALPINENKFDNYESLSEEKTKEKSYSIKKPPRKSVKSDSEIKSQGINLCKLKYINMDASEIDLVPENFSPKSTVERINKDIKVRNGCFEGQFGEDNEDKMMNSKISTKAERESFYSVSPQNNTTSYSVDIKELTTMSIEEKVTKFFDKQECKNMEYHKLPFQETSKSTFETFRNYFELLDSMDENGDSEIIRELVLSRYGAEIQTYLGKSEKRRSRLSLNKGISKESLRSIDSGNNSISDDIVGDEEIYQDGELSLTIFEDILEETNQSNDIECMKEKFFQEQNGKCVIYESSNVQEIFEDEFETILVNTSVTSLVTDKPIEGFEETSKKPMEKFEQKSQMEETPESDQNKGAESLMQKLYIQTATILEVSKALDFCKKFKEYSESIQRVEAEHILLIATLRKGIILDEMTEVDNEPINILRNGYVRMNSIVVTLTSTKENNSKGASYYVCVLQCGSSVFTSGVLQPDDQSNLTINKIFYFKELPHDFEINVQVYSLFIKMGNKIKKSSVILKDVNNAFYSLKQYLSPRKTSRYGSHSNTLKKSSFVLCGRCIITRANLQQKSFKIQKVYPAYPITESLTCQIEYFAKITNRASGFLTVGEQFNGILMWNRQWCILEDAKLKFWDYPGKENEIQANRVIDMSRCVLKTIPQADKSSSFRCKTLYLKLGPESVDEEYIHTDYYLSADNQDDFRLWSVELNCVLTTLLLWNYIKPYIC